MTIKKGQACTYKDADGREFSARIESVGETPLNHSETGEQQITTVCSVMYEESGKQRRAELVPEDRISNVHDFDESESEEVKADTEEILEPIEDLDEE